MVKGLSAWEMSIKNDACKFSVRPFSGWRLNAWKTTSNLLLEKTPTISSFVGTNDVSDEKKSPELIAESVMNLTSDNRMT